MIERRAGAAPNRSSVVVHGGMAKLVVVPQELSPSTYEQAPDAFRMLDRALADIGSDKQRVLSIMVYLARMGDKQQLNRAWDEWASQAAAPMRACLGVELTPGYLVELIVDAVV